MKNLGNMSVKISMIEYIITVVSRASAHSQVSAHVAVLAFPMESVHSRASAQVTWAKINTANAHQYFIQEYNVKISSCQSLTLCNAVLSFFL